jgi:hypothetical protein
MDPVTQVSGDHPVDPFAETAAAAEAEAETTRARAAETDFTSLDDGNAGEHTPIEPPVEGASPLVSHMVRLGPPPLPALRHRRQAPDADKTPTVADASSPQTIPPMSLASGPLSQPARRRVNIWGLGAVLLAAVGILAVVSSQRRSGSRAAAPPPAAPPLARAPEATPLNPAAAPPAPATAAKPATPAAKPPAVAAVGPDGISELKKGTVTVEKSGTTSIFTFPLAGSSKGARRQLLTAPPGVSLLLPRGRPKALPGIYKPAGDLLTVQVNRKGAGSEVRFMYDESNDARMELDSRKVTLLLTRKQ